MVLEIEIRHCMYSGFASGISPFALEWIRVQPDRIKWVMGLLCIGELPNRAGELSRRNIKSWLGTLGKLPCIICFSNLYAS